MERHKGLAARFFSRLTLCVCLVERVWSQLKVEWGKFLAQIDTNYNHDNMPDDVG